MRTFLPFLITGIVSGSLYGLAGVGLVLTYRTSGIFNFGHGAIGASAAFMFYELHVSHRLSWPLAALLTIAFCSVVVALALEWLTRQLARGPEVFVIVGTVGLLIGIQGLLFVIFGNQNRAFPTFFPTSGFTLSGVNVSWAQVISVTIASASVTGLYVCLRYSRLGVAMRAVVDNPSLVALSGAAPIKVRQAAWMIGSGFAAMSGILLAPTLGLDASLLSFLVVQAFGACAIGLFTSLPLTYLGGFGVGVAASLATRYFTGPPFNGVPPAVPFLVLLAVLLIVPMQRFPRRPLQTEVLRRDQARRARSYKTPAAGALGGLLVLPHLVKADLPVWTSGLILMIMFSSLRLLVWTSGQISLCHAALVAVGASTMSHLTGSGIPWLISLVGAAAVAVPVGALVAIPAIRLSGLYLALATLGFGILMQNVVYPTSFMFGRQLIAQSPRPKFGIIDGAKDIHFYYIVLAVAVAAVALLLAVTRARLGRFLQAMSETPAMLTTHGLQVNLTRLIVFCLSAFAAGLSGALLISQFGSASSVGYGPVQSLLFVAVIGICGRSPIRGPVLASLFLAVLPGYSTRFAAEQQMLAFGLLALVAPISATLSPGIRRKVAAWLLPGGADSVHRRQRRPCRQLELSGQGLAHIGNLP